MLLLRSNELLNTSVVIFLAQLVSGTFSFVFLPTLLLSQIVIVCTNALLLTVICTPVICFLNARRRNKASQRMWLNYFVKCTILGIGILLIITFLWEFWLEPIVFENIFSKKGDESIRGELYFVLLIFSFCLIAVMIFSQLFKHLFLVRLWNLDSMKNIVQTANAPIFGVDIAGNITEWNKKAEEITGFLKPQVLGRNLVNDFISKDYKHQVRAILQKGFNGDLTSNFQLPVYTKQGGRIEVLLNFTAQYDAKKRMIGLVGIGQDITELKKMQAQVIQSSKLACLGEMSTCVAHEINQPLNTIRMASANMRDRLESEVFDHVYFINKLQRIDDQITRASEIINHMRMFGREANEKPAYLDPREVMKQAISLVSEQLRLENIEMAVGCEGQYPAVLGHKILMEQVFVNILLNARDAIIENDQGTKRKITIMGGLVEEGKLEISISDTGRGVPEESLDKIFEPFYTTKPMEKGTGLGLSVSYGIIHDMGGSLSVKNIEGGAKFLIKLPAS